MKTNKKITSKEKSILTTEGRRAIAEQVADRIIEKGAPSDTLLQELDRIDVESPEYVELVLTSRPEVSLTGEQNGLAPLPNQTQGMRYARVSALFTKVFARALITDEIANDAKVSVNDAVVSLAGEDFLNVLINEVLHGDESRTNRVQRLRGILDSRIDKAGDFSEALKADDARHPEYYQVHKTGVTGAFGTDSASIRKHFLSLKKSLPSKYRRTAKWYMNADVFEALEEVVDASGQLLLIHWGRSAFSKEESFIMLGHPIVIIDQMTGEGNSATPVMFGDLRAAIKVLDLRGEGSYCTVDKVTVKGAGITYVDSRYGEIMQANDALRMSLQAA